jgi:MOSC domain-containing protein YiiM
MTIEVVAVNVGTPTLLAQRADAPVYSAIAKQPVPSGTALWLSTGNLAGDAQADLSVHGGPDKAVYAYPTESLASWSAELDETLQPGAFGENLSTRGATEHDVCIGDVWQWNNAVLQVTQPRWPCFKLALYRKRADVQQRMRASGRTGWYLRVLVPGEVVVGGPIEVSARDRAQITVFDAHAAMLDRNVTDRRRLEALVQHNALAAEWREPLERRLSG